MEHRVQRSLKIGDLVGGEYRLRAPLGSGGMGIVYEAEGAAGETVAVKVLHPDHETDAAATRRFHAEAIAAGYITHPNVVAVLDFSRPEDEAQFVVMEHVRGIGLGTILRRGGALPLRRSCDIACQILAGVGAAHDVGVVHADIKSDNILVESHRDGTDTIKIIDFGLASIQRGDHPRPGREYDHDGRLLTSGTPEYMAPEVIRGDGAIAASDLYAVGVILYEMLTGKTPFAGGESREILERQLRDWAVPPSLRRPDRFIPLALERAIMRALEKDPTVRHASAALFASAIAKATPLVEPPPVTHYVAPSSERPQVTARRRLASGTSSGMTEKILHLREELATAFAHHAIDDVVVTALELARLLVDGHHAALAARELEGTIDTLTEGGGVGAPDAPEPLWRLLLTLAALYQSLGARMRARQAAVAAHRHAGLHRSDVGCARAASLLERLDL